MDQELERRFLKLENELKQLKANFKAEPGLSTIAGLLSLPDIQGTWTPALNLGTAVLSGYDRARYVLIGKLCFVSFYAGDRTLSGSAGTVGISLPFAPAYNSYYGIDTNAYDTGSAAWRKVRADTSAAGGSLIVYKTAQFAANWAANETGVYIAVNGAYEVQ